MHGSDRINFHFYFAGISILDDSTLPLLQIVACFPKKSRFHGNSCHSCYIAEISHICQLHVNYERSNFFDFVLRTPILSYVHSGLAEFVAAFFFILHNFVPFLFRCTFHAASTFYSTIRLSKFIYWLRYRFCASFSETFTKNRPSGVNRFRREGAIDDIGSSSELVCRVRARYIIESNFAVKSVRPKLCLMAV